MKKHGTCWSKTNLGLLCGEKQNLATQYFMRFINVQDTYSGIIVKKNRISWQ